MTGIYQTVPRTRDYWHELCEMSESFVDSIPNFDKRLDSFFKQNAEAIIDEWELVTDDDLQHLRKKLDYLSYEVGRLVVEKGNFENRVLTLRSAIEDLEKK